jgi:hypothetical protein
MGLVETDYQVEVEDKYVVTIKSPRTPNQKAILYLDLDQTGEIYDVTYTNNLFQEHLWADFCRVFTDEMPQLMNETHLLNMINTLINN